MSTNTQIRDQFNLFLSAEDVESITQNFENLKKLIPALSSAPAGGFYPTIRDNISPTIPFILNRFFQVLDERWNYYSANRKLVLESQRKSIVVSGGGPCGLRASVEFALLGFNITLIEKRKIFSRHNILKTWTPTVEDLLCLGFKTYFPSFQIHGIHCIGTRELQICLLRTALLLGVNFIYGESTAGIVEPGFKIPGDADLDPSRWRIITNTTGLVVNTPIIAPSPVKPLKEEEQIPNKSQPEEVPSEQPQPPSEQCIKVEEHPLPPQPQTKSQPEEVPSEQPQLKPTPEPQTQPEEVPTELSLKIGEQNYERLEKHSKVDYFEKATSLDGAIFRDESALPPEIKNIIPFDSLIVAEGESSRLIRHLGFDRYVTRFGPAIGIIVNCVFNRNNSTEKRLQEFVVYRSQADWRQTCLGKLYEHGIEVENMEYMRFSTHFMVVTAKKDSLVKYGVLKESKETIQDSLVKENIDFDRLYQFGRHLATSAGVPETCPFAAAHAVNIFDFSCKGLLTKPFTTLIPKHNDDNNFHHPLVLPIGDSLINPFWPQGLGVNRGFHTSLDAVWTILLDTIPSSLANSTSRDIALSERDVSHRMNLWFPLMSPLVHSGLSWRADPLTRYVPKIPQTMHMNDVQKHAVVSSLTPRILNTLNLKLPSHN